MSAPIASPRAIPTGPEYWRNPCGFLAEANNPPYSDQILAEAYASQLRQDLIYVNQWKDKFVSVKFQLKMSISFDINFHFLNKTVRKQVLNELY